MLPTRQPAYAKVYRFKNSSISCNHSLHVADVDAVVDELFDEREFNVDSTNDDLQNRLFTLPDRAANVFINTVSWQLIELTRNT